MKTLPEQVECLERALAMRRREYPRHVQEGRMTQAKADHEIECMEAALFTVEKARVLKEIGDEMMKGSKS